MYSMVTVVNNFLYLEVARSGEGNGTPLQYSGLENPMDRGAWWATVHGVSKELNMTEQLTNSVSSLAVDEHCGGLIDQNV